MDEMSTSTTPLHQTMDSSTTSLRRPHHDISTSSDEMRHDGSSTDSANEWSVSHRNRRLKKKKTVGNSNDIIPPTPSTPTVPTSTHNPFTSLPIDVPPTATPQQPPTAATPPPVFIKTVTDYTLLRTDLNRLIGQDSYTTKSTMTGMTLKTKTPNAYRTVITYLREKNADFHTYQNPADKPYRVAIRHLHPATPPNDIAEALEEKGHRVRNVHNAIHPRLKTPLALFFVDLEPTENNNAIFRMTSLLNSTIRVEEPYKRVEIPQCTKCQEYHHTKAYCNHPARCVKCGGGHATAACLKTRDSPATCALCHGPHPANYKGCQVYQELQRKRRHQPITSASISTDVKTVNNPISRPPVSTTHFPTIVHTPPPPSQPVYTHPSRVNTPVLSYAQVTAHTDTTTPPQQLPVTNPTDQTNLTTQLTNFLTDFKNMITPLITLLTTVITKFINP